MRQFCRKLAQADEASILEGLLATFNARSHTAHEVACAILWAWEIPYTRDLASDLPRMLSAWDPSIEELPFYLTEACGQQSVEEALSLIRVASNQSPSMKNKIETMHSWMRVPNEVMLEAKTEWLKKLDLAES